MPLKIFLSYPSDHADRVAEVSYALEAEGHAVFFDRDRLPAGAGYHARIRRAVEESDLFIFFITPESVAPGRYTLTELKFARAKWDNPEDRLLPVLVAPTPLDRVPAYLKAVTILSPEGNLPAEVAARVAELAARGPAAPPPVAAPPGPRPGPQIQAPSYGALHIAFRGGGESGYPLEVTESPGGASAAAPCRIDPAEVESLLWSPGESARVAVRRAGPEAALPTPEGVRRVGERLYETLFATHLRDSLDASLRQLDPQRGFGVRFVINTTDAPELSGIPWEFTYRKSDEDFLFSDRLTPVVRWLDLERPLPTLAVEPPLRLLVAVAAPSDQPALSVGEEIASLGNELGELAADGILEPIHLDHTSLERLDKALVDKAPHVLHFIGHGDFQGDEGVLMLESEESPGASAPLTGRRLAVLLRNHLTSLRLVFLNSCLGAAVASRNPFSGVAQSLMRRGMPAVIAMQFPIPDRAAVALAREFYRYLAAGLPVDAALTSARAFLFAKGYEVEWGAPALHMRTPDARLFAIPGAPELVAAVPAAPSPPTVEPAAPAPAAGAAGRARPVPSGRRGRPLVLALALIALVLGLLGGGYFAFREGPDERGYPGVEPVPGDADDGGTAAVVVPDLVGRPLEEVLRALAERGLSPGGVEYWPSDRQPPGTVLEMRPPPGAEVARGSEIHLVVAQPPVRAAPVSWLTVHKRVVGAGEGGGGAADFTLLVDGRPVASGERLEVAPGRHVVSERGGAAGFRAAFSGDCDATGQIDLAAGEEKSCTLTNDYASAVRGRTFCEQLLGGVAGSCFAPEPVGSLAELQTLFDRYRDDLRAVLDRSGWEGDPDDLFEAVRQSREGDGTVTRRSVRPGETFRWMAYRRNGRPDVLRDYRWSGDLPFGAWQIEVESRGGVHVFTVPTSCLCPAYEGSMALAAPSCDLEASFDAAADLITVTGKSDGESLRITGLLKPDGAGSPADLQSTAAMRWSYRPTADGTYRFSAEATTGARSASCSATVQVTRAKPMAAILREAPEFRWIARGYPLWVEATASGGDERVSVDGGPGLGFGIEYRFRRRLGLEAAIALAELEIARDGVTDELRYRQLTAGLNFHLTPDRRVDVYVGPVLGLVGVGGEFDEDLAWGATLGLDLPVGGRWRVVGGLRYLESSAEAGAAGGDLRLDPLVVSVGLSLRY